MLCKFGNILTGTVKISKTARSMTGRMRPPGAQVYFVTLLLHMRAIRCLMVVGKKILQNISVPANPSAPADGTGQNTGSCRTFANSPYD